MLFCENLLPQKLERPSLQSRSLVFIDDRVEDYELLIAGMRNGVEAIVLDRRWDGIEQIAKAMQEYALQYGALDAVHLVSHGSPGCLQLGNTVLNSETLERYGRIWQQWRSLLAEKAEILIYGCNVAAGVGTEFIRKLGELTGTAISASTTLTGNRDRGGNWELNFATKEQQVSLAFKPEVMASYPGVLAMVTVTNAADSGSGSLRNAIATAQPGDTIAFDSSLANQTITLTSGQLEIEKNLIVDGASAPGLTISGNNASRVFFIKEDVNFVPTNVTLRNLTIADGKAIGSLEEGAGGGIKTASRITLTLENSTLRNNVATGEGGGGLFAGYQSNNTIINSTFEGNDGTPTNSERGGGAIAIKSESNTTITDSTFTNNRGINGGAINSLLGGLTVENSTFTNNDSTAGGVFNQNTRGYAGAIFTDGASATIDDTTSGDIIIRNSVFDGNKGAGQGGGLFLFVYDGDRVMIENSRIVNNQVIKSINGDALGGGLRLGNGEVSVRNTTFANNVAESQGGGLWVGERTNLDLVNTTFSGNRAELANTTDGLGGAIAISIRDGYQVNILNSTIANNVAGFQGGGFWGGGSDTTLTNTIVANNVGVNGFNVKQQTGFQFNDGGNNIQFPGKNPNNSQDVNVTANAIIVDPLLGSLQEINGTLIHPLLPGSPAIDAANPATAPATDQRGIARPVDGDENGTAISDIGAFELSTNVVVQGAEIQVLDATTDILDNSTTAIAIGTTTEGTAIAKTFTLKNTGTADLTLSNLQLPTGFTAVGTLPATIPANGETTLEVQLDATAAGTPSGELSFSTNDSDENPFNFPISGTVNAAPSTDGGTGGSTGDGISPLEPILPESLPVSNTNGDRSDLAAAVCDGQMIFANPNPVADTLFSGGVNPFFANDTAQDVFGTTSDDFLLGMGGNDNLYGGTGNDTLHANTGSDRIDAGEGNDWVHGGQQNDTLFGFDGNDTLFGDNDNDWLWGGNDDDFLNGNRGDDTLFGFDGNDTLHGGKQNDRLFGEAGDDFLFGDNDNDQLCAGDGNDFLNGNRGDDSLSGGEGSDTLRGGQESDRLFGGNGDDVLWGDLGNDTLTGGNGSDRFVFRMGDGSDVITDFTDGIDLLGLADGLTFSQLSISGSNGNTQISVGGELLVTIANVEATLINESDFTII